MPVQSNFLNHFVTLASLVGTQNYVEKDDDVDHYSGKYVKSVKPCDEEKEVGKEMNAAA